ncbi:MarR family transcriptional regulator [Microbacterium invictum]
MPASADDRLWQSPVGHDLSFVLARANAVSLAGVHAALAEHGLRVRQYSVLAIAAADTRPSQRELSDFLRLDPSQIVAVVDHLESRDLVRREPDPNDRRAKVVVATAAGKTLYRRAKSAAERADGEFLARLDASEIAALAPMLRKLAWAPEIV